MAPSPALGERSRAPQIGKKGHELYEWHRCLMCDKERWVVIIKGQPGSDLCKKCGVKKFNETRQGANSPLWKGERRVDSTGYVTVYVPDGHRFAAMRIRGRYIAEHRLVIAEHLNRCLTRNEVVHHKDGDRTNNALANLQLTTLGEHSKDHSLGYRHGYEHGYADGMAAGAFASLNGWRQ